MQSHQLVAIFVQSVRSSSASTAAINETKRPKISENAVLVRTPDSEFILNIIEKEYSLTSPSYSKHFFGTVIFASETRLLKNGHRVHVEDFCCIWGKCSNFFV
jgi:hypothetical protein